jgi:hypothetical protein
VRPRDVLAQHLDLVAVLGNGETSIGRYLTQVAILDKVISKTSSIGPTLAQNLANSRAYMVTEEMTGHVTAYAATMHELTQVGEDIPPPRQCGFVVLEESISWTELRGRTQIMHALCWGPAIDQHGAPGWMVLALNDMARKPDDMSRPVSDDPKLRRAFGRWHGIGTWWLPRGLRIGPEIITPTEEDIARVVAEGDTPYPTRNMARAFLALWGLLDETISTHTHERSDRAIMRLAARRKLPTEVTVITLRREAQPVQHPGTGTSPSYRQWIDGVRRRYWVGSGPDRHQEWRNTRGFWWPNNPDLPIKHKPKVNRLSR